MIRIAIIEDDDDMMRIVSKCVKESSMGVADLDICCLTNAEDFLDKAKQEEFDILFSDIELPGMNGIELGKLVREKYPELYLVYLTSHSEFAAESYTIEAYQYILKKDMESRFPLVVKRLVDKISKEHEQYRWIGTFSDKKKIYYKDIISISKLKGAKYVEYVTVNDIFRERIPLECLLRELNSKEFIVVERGFVVNMKHIARVAGNTLYLDNGDKAMISRARIAEVKEQIHLYWRGI